MDSPLNSAHQQGRKADMLSKTGKFDEAMACHNRAAEYILEAMQQTKYKAALESLRLQHAHHLKQTDQLFDRQRRAQLLQIKHNRNQLSNQSTQTVFQGQFLSSNLDQASSTLSFQTSLRVDNMYNSTEDNTSMDADSIYRTLTENDSLVGLLIRRQQNLNEENMKSCHSGVPVERVFFSKSSDCDVVGQKDKKNTEEEDLKLLNEDLRKHVQHLLREVDDIKRERDELKERLGGSQIRFCDVGVSDIEILPDLPPLEMPKFDFKLFDQDNKSDDNSDL